MSKGVVSIFDSLIGKYEVPKTLRFELKPVGKTSEYLKQTKVFEKDKLVDDHYHQIKYYFDAFHRKFIDESLKNVSFSEDDVRPYYDALKKFKTSNKDEKKKIKLLVEKEEGKLREKIVEVFNTTGNVWKEKFAKKGVEFDKEGVEILFEDAVLEALEKEFPVISEDDKNAPAISFIDPVTGKPQNLFRSFDGFFTYFTNFNETKRNLYSVEGHDTAVANRAVNENLRQFIENKFQLEDFAAEYRACGVTDEEIEKFSLKSYGSCLSQAGIDSYNQLIGRISDDPSHEGLNQKINQFNQKNKGKKLPQFAQLFKQILSKKDIKERSLEIADASHVFPVLREFIDSNNHKLVEAQKIMRSFFDSSDQYDLAKVYLKNSALNTISQKWFINWSVVGRLLVDTKKKAKNEEEEIIKLPNFVSIAELKNALEVRSSRESELFIAAKDLFRGTYEDVYKTTTQHYETFVRIWQSEWNACVDEYVKNEQVIERMLQKNKVFSVNDDEVIQEIRMYGESALAVFQMMKYFALEKGRKKVQPDNGVDNDFYNPFNAYYQDYNPSNYFDEIRNFVTAKPYLGRLRFPSFGGGLEQRDARSKRVLDGAEKIKLNFDCSSFLSGWSGDFERYGGLIFRKSRVLNGHLTHTYYLGVIKENLTETEVKSLTVSSGIKDQSNFEIMNYKFQKMDFKNFPRLFINSKGDKQSPAIAKYHLPIETIWEKYQVYKKLDNEKREFFLAENPNFRFNLIEYYKKCAPLHDSIAPFKEKLPSFWKKTEEYKNLSEFYRDTMRATYELKLEEVNLDAVLGLADSEKLYLFQIYNKDFELDETVGQKKYGEDFIDKVTWKKQKKIEEKETKNVHTLYFESLFEQLEKGSGIIKLSGDAEIFFRPKNENLKKTNENKIEHQRYGEDKIFLHLSIALNMAEGEEKINEKVNKIISLDKDGKIIKIIGVDRGEKHLGYLAVVDQNGKLVSEPKNLDGVLPNEQTYLKKLEEKAENRDSARKEWKTIEKIKELKNGYISQVVHDLTSLMVEENAVLVFEDLNSGFKRSRQKIEQQVYQKLELALAKKLNYLVDKKAAKGKPGHYLKGLQLTPPIKTFQDIGKQCGALFYVSPAYTSLTCPECGYRKNVSFSFENIGKAQKHVKDIDLHFKEVDNGFEIFYTLNNQGKKKTFKISSAVERLRWHRHGTTYAKHNGPGEEVVKNTETSVGLTKKYKISDCLQALFTSEASLTGKKEIFSSDLAKIENADFYRQLFRYLEILLHSRNSISGTEIDYIQCPRCLFHSDNGFCGFKYNGDANGAFNIARKGLLALRKIQQAEDPENIKWADLKVDVQEWDEFVSAEWERKNGG